LSPTQIAVLADPDQVQHIRNVVHFEVAPRNSRAAQPFRDRVEFDNPIQSQANAAAATNVVVTVTPPTGNPLQITSSSVPDFASLAPGSSAKFSTTYQVPAVAAKGANEADADYLKRLSSFEGKTLQATAVANATGLSRAISSAQVSVTTVEHLPIVGITKTGAGAAASGSTVNYQVALKNSGGAQAGSLGLIDTLSNGDAGTVSSVPATLAPGASATAQASYAIPANLAAGTLTDTATVTWQDAKGNTYGPVSSAFATQVTPTVPAEIEPVTTTIVEGTFFAESPSAQAFVAKPGDTPAFGQSFPTINFNPPNGVIPHNISGVGPQSRPFTDVTTDLVGDFAGTIVAQGNGMQAGVGGLSTFDSVFTSNFVINKPGDVTYNVIVDDGFLLGIGGGAVRVSGVYENAPASNTSPFKGYPLVGAFNRPGGNTPTTYAVTVHFPSAGVYPYELDYFSCCHAQLSLTLAVASFTEQTSPLSVFVGYADGLRPAGSIFPFPWQGSPGVTFVGCSNCAFDAGAVRFDNSSSSPITLDSVTVDVGSFHFDIWPRNLTVPANQILILTQTVQFNFDTSDLSSSPCGVNNGVIPQLNVTIAGVTTTFKDTQQVLNTGGFDSACKGNESIAWQRIGGVGTSINTPLPPAVTLTLAPGSFLSDAVVGLSRHRNIERDRPGGRPAYGLQCRHLQLGHSQRGYAGAGATRDHQSSPARRDGRDETNADQRHNHTAVWADHRILERDLPGRRAAARHAGLGDRRAAFPGGRL